MQPVLSPSAQFVQYTSAVRSAHCTPETWSSTAYAQQCTRLLTPLSTHRPLLDWPLSLLLVLTGRTLPILLHLLIRADLSNILISIPIPTIILLTLTLSSKSILILKLIFIILNPLGSFLTCPLECFFRINI